MTVERDQPPPSSDASVRFGPDTLSEQVNDNIDSIVAFQEREQEKLGGSERRLAHVSDLIGQPLYLISLLSFVALWTSGNLVVRLLGLASFDPPPFLWLQGILTLGALLTTTVILITQNRQARIENQRAHLDLQVNLLTEQKVTKLIHLLEELRRDLPMVKDRHDPEAASLQQRTDTAQMLSALANVDAAIVGKKASADEPSSA
jgi:uncharacterized membrane protein